MAHATWSAQDAKNRFSAVMEAAHREPQIVTKHGKPSVVVIDADEFARLRGLDRAQAPSLPELLLAIPKDDEEFERIDVVPRDVDF